MKILNALTNLLLEENIDTISSAKDVELISHHMLGSLAYRKSGAEAKQAFFPAHLFVVQKRALFDREMPQLLESFQKKGIAPLIVKGISLADRWYSHPEDRPFSDLDLVFLPKDRIGVQEVLQKEFEEILQPRFSANSHKQDWQLKRNPTFKVEAHFSLGHEKYEQHGFWKNSLEWKGWKVLASQEEFVFLLFHGMVQHRMQKLIWFLDLLKVSKGFSDEELRDLAKKHGMEAAFSLFSSWRQEIQSKSIRDAWLRRVLLQGAEHPLRSAQLRAKIYGGWRELIQYAVDRRLQR
jgi:hypothetical protein